MMIVVDNKITAEIIPWVHHVGHRLQIGALESIKSLPKNSVVFIEGSEKDLVSAEKFVDAFKKIGFDHKYLSETDMDLLAVIEIVSAARSRNARLIPIDTFVSRIGAKGQRTKSLDFKGYYRSAIKRDKLFAKQINSFFTEKKIEKVFVLAGSAHVAGLTLELSNFNITPKLRFEGFSKGDVRYMQNLIENAKTVRKAFFERNNVLFERALQEKRTLLRWGGLNPKASKKRLIEFSKVLSDKNSKRVSRLERLSAVKKNGLHSKRSRFN